MATLWPTDSVKGPTFWPDEDSAQTAPSETTVWPAASAPPVTPSYRLLEGDMQSGTDHRLLEGDMQSGTDKRLLQGDMA